VSRLALALTMFLVPAAALAAPALRFQIDGPGGYQVLGQTLGYDCGSGNPPPAGSSASCTGVFDGDAAPDLYWRDNLASPATAASDARTSADLVLPADATVTYARLYWGGLRANALPDREVTLDREGGFSTTVMADPNAANVVLSSGPVAGVVYVAYQASADVTSLVRTNGAGSYRVTGVDGIALNGVLSENAFSAWHLVVIYGLPSGPTQHLALYDGLDTVAMDTDAAVTIDGFRVPSAGAPQGSLAAWAYESDASQTGDALRIRGMVATNAGNAADNFWNESRTRLGAGVTGDVPALSGLPGTGAGFDLDEVDLGPLLAPGDTSFTLTASTTTDGFWFGGFVLAMATDGPPPGLDGGSGSGGADGGPGVGDGGGAGDGPRGAGSDGSGGADSGGLGGTGGAGGAGAGGAGGAAGSGTGGTGGGAPGDGGAPTEPDDSAIAEGSGCRCGLTGRRALPAAAVLPGVLLVVLVRRRRRRPLS
jgi:hypothetical protein